MKNYEAIQESNILSRTMPCFVDRACFLGNRMLDNELCIYRNALEEMGSLKFGVCTPGALGGTLPQLIKVRSN